VQGPPPPPASGPALVWPRYKASDAAPFLFPPCVISSNFPIFFPFSRMASRGVGPPQFFPPFSRLMEIHSSLWSSRLSGKNATAKTFLSSFFLRKSVSPGRTRGRDGGYDQLLFPFFSFFFRASPQAGSIIFSLPERPR